MASRGWSTLWLHLMVAVAAMSTWWQLANSEPQTNLLRTGCSDYNATTDFFNKLNVTFSDLRNQLSGGSGRRFATAQQEGSSDPVYAMVQRRDYMTEADCLACYDAAVSDIRACPNNGARRIYDGYFLRYESYNFYPETIQNAHICGNTSAPQPNADAFTTGGKTLLRDLEVATPRIRGYFAASKREVSNGGDSTIYGVAQCVQTVSQSGCQNCLTAAYESLQGCFPVSEGRVIDVACFLRYSDTPFFADNRTTDIKPFP